MIPTLILLAALATSPYVQNGYLPPEVHQEPEDAFLAPPQDFDVPPGRYPEMVEQWRPLVAGHFGDLGPDAVDTALCLMVFESGGKASARNPSSGASGLMQVLPSWAPKFDLDPADLFTPEVNLWVARQLYDDGGWHHWSPYQRGECR